jgi:hypothetical protein
MNVDPVFDDTATARDLLPNSIAAHVAVFVQALDTRRRSSRNIGVLHPTGIVPHSRHVGVQRGRVAVSVIGLRRTSTHGGQAMRRVVPPRGIGAVAIDVRDITNVATRQQNVLGHATAFEPHEAIFGADSRASAPIAPGVESSFGCGDIVKCCV